VQLNYPENLCFNCSKCGLCCGDTPSKTRHVLLPWLDAKEIARFTDKPIGDFATPINGKRPYVFEMRKTPDGKCVFLKDNKCTIYEIRPLICMFYPFELKTCESGVYSFRFTEECPGIFAANVEQNKALDREFFMELLNLAVVKLNR
jgi:Fe-S-cluster containining protein